MGDLARRVFALSCLAWLGWGCADQVRAQERVPEGPVRGFSLPILDKTTLKRKALVRGQSASPAGKDLWEIREVQFESYAEDGRTNLTVRSARCLCQVREERLSSPEKLELRSRDGMLSIEGTGFGWEEKGGLTISNAVEAVVRKSALRESGAGGAAVAVGDTRSREELRVWSERLRYREGVARFEGNVRVTDAQGQMRCQQLVMRLNMPDQAVVGETPEGLSGRLEVIEAIEGVEIEVGDLVATAERAIYHAPEERLELLGKPAWRSGSREGQAERMTIHRLRRELLAERDVVVRLPTDGVVEGGEFLPAGVGPAADPTKPPERIEISSEQFGLRPAEDRPGVQEARFQEQVVVQAERGNLRCQSLTIWSVAAGAGREVVTGGTGAGRENEFRPLSAVAEGAVRIEQGTNRVECVRAEYTAETRQVELTGGVDWALGGREGRSDGLRLDAGRRASLARGNVRMRMPAGSFAPAALLMRGGLEGRTGGGRAVAAKEPVPVGISCGEFEYVASPGKGEPATVSFRGGVEVRNPPEMSLTCDRLDAWMEAVSNRVDRLVAEREVVFRVKEAGAERTARGDRAVYEAGASQLRLTGTNGVELVSVDASGAGRVTGRSVVYDGERDVLEVESEAVLDSPKGWLAGDRARLDRANGIASASGMWKIRLPARVLKDTLPPVDKP